MFVTHYIACFHVSPSRLLTAAPMLKTNDVNQKVLTALATVVSVFSKENCIVVAVTAEKNVATVLRFSKFWLACMRRIVVWQGSDTVYPLPGTNCMLTKRHKRAF